MAETFALLTGPVVGEYTLADGTVYDVSQHDIQVDSLEHAQELSYLIGLHHEKHGHPHHDRDTPFKVDRSKETGGGHHKFAKGYKVHPDNSHLES